MSIVCFGLSHQTARVDVRERFAVETSSLQSTLHALTSIPEIQEAVVLSTCNRVEYYLTIDPSIAFGRHMVERWIQQVKAIDATDSKLFYYHDFPNSVEHLFRVACSLESMVVGETEILGQVKSAYQVAHQSGTTSRYLNKLFQHTFQVAKQVRSETSIGCGAVSIGSVAVHLAEKLFGSLDHCRTLILGAGEMGERTARSLHSRGVRTILVSNRKHERALTLAQELNGEAIHFEEWMHAVHNVDILIGSTSAPHYVVTQKQLKEIMRQRHYKPLFVIDLAVPRDVEPSVNDLEGVYLYDVDSLETIAQQGRSLRSQELTLCQKLVAQNVQKFTRWREQQEKWEHLQSAGEAVLHQKQLTT